MTVMMLASPSAWSKEEHREISWRWRIYSSGGPDYDSPEAAVDARNAQHEAAYAQCIAGQCQGTCSKTIYNPPTQVASGATKINGQWNYLLTNGGTHTSYFTACNNVPANGPVSTPVAGPIGVFGNRDCPSNWTVRGYNNRSETVNGAQHTVVENDCVRFIPDCNDCSQKEGTPPARFGNPVDAIGNAKIQTETDYVSADGLLRVSRSYSSRTARWSWSHGTTIADFTGRATSSHPALTLIANVKLIPPNGSGIAVDTPRSFPLIKSPDLQTPPQVWRVGGDSSTTVFNENAGAFSSAALSKPQLSLVAGPAGGQRWLLRMPGGKFELYELDGRLIQEMFADGRSLTYQTTSGSLTVTAFPGGRQLTYSRSSQNLPAGVYDVVTLPDSSQVVYALDLRALVDTVTYPDSSTRTYLYDESEHSGIASSSAAAGRLTGLLDENQARHATYKYDAGGPISTELAEEVNKYIFNSAFDAASGVRNITMPLSNALTRVGWSLGPDGERRVTSSQQPAGAGSALSSTSLAYDVNGYVASITDYKNNRTCYTHDASRGVENARIEGIANAGACPSNIATYSVPLNTRQRKISTAWHPQWNFPTARAEPKKITRWVYNGQPDPATGQNASCAPATALLPDGTSIAVVCKRIEQATTDANGTAGLAAVPDGSPRVWAFTYNAYGQVLTMDGPRTDVTDVVTYTYNDCNTGYQCGRVHRVTDALGHFTTYNSYDAHGQPLSITDQNSVLITLNYDLRQRLISRVAGLEVTSFDYWPTGLLKKATLPDGSYLEYTYDDAHRLTGINDRLGNRIEYTLDGAGNRIREEAFDSSGAPVRLHTRAFDVLSRLQQEIGTAGTVDVTTSLAYDNNGNQTSIAAPLGRDTAQAYDELNRLTTVTDPLNGITRYGYNSLDQLTSVTDPKGLVTSYDYNGLGDLKQQTSPDTGITTNTYDSAGNLETRTDARGVSIGQAAYTYDALNRVTQIAYPDHTVTYQYDTCINGVGRLCAMTDTGGTTVYEYDDHGRVTIKAQTASHGSSGLTQRREVHYTYTNGLLTRRQVRPGGIDVYYDHDANGRISEIRVRIDDPQYPQEETVLTNVLYDADGQILGWTWGNGQLTVREYDGDGRPTLIDSHGQSSYTYDDASRITSITSDGGVQFNATPWWTYGYDDLDRVISASRPVSPFTNRTYGYDANGNRTSQGGTDAVAFNYSNPLTSNRLGSTSGALNRTYQYDAAGNRISDGITTFTYDGAGRMVTSSAGSTTYGYNGLGVRMTKHIAGGLSGGHYIYDEAGHLIEKCAGYAHLGDACDEYTTQQIIWLDDIPVASTSYTLTYDSEGYVDWSFTELFQVHTDHLNTPRKLQRSGISDQLAWSWGLGDPFGVGPASGGYVQWVYPSLDLRFPGQVYDSETGLHYNYYRDYDPATGRYIESDPTGLWGGINTYAYADNSPVSDIDPTGENPVAAGIRAWGIGSRIGNGINNAVESGTGRSIGSLIYDVTHPEEMCPDDCAKIEAQIAAVAAELRQRYLRALQDPKDLYNRARSTPFSRRAGTWAGHRQQFMNLQAKLQNLISTADAKGCRVSPDDRALSTAPYPDTPLPP